MKKRIKYFKNLFKGFFEIDNLKSIEKAPVMFFCHDFTRNYEFNKKKYSSLVDTINDLVMSKGLRTITIARPYSHFSTTECYGNVVKVNGGFARARFLDFFLNIFKKNNCNLFQIKFWNKTLSHIDCKIIIGIEPFKELVISAKKNEIIVFDLQHGIISSTPPPHFYRLSLREPDQNGWPNYIICRDLESFMFLNNNRKLYTVPLLLGHPWVSRFFSNNNSDLLLNEVEEKFKNLFHKPIILFSLQHLRDENGTPHDYSKIPNSIVNLIKSDFGKKFQWCIRLHPILLSEPNYTLVNNNLFFIFKDQTNVEWNISTKVPLPFLLKYTRLHFTRDSSTAFEAAQLKIKTGLLDSPEAKDTLINNFKNLIDEKLAFILPYDNELNLKSFIENNIEINHYDTKDFEKQNTNFYTFTDLLNDYLINNITHDFYSDSLISSYNRIYANSSFK